MPPGLNGTGQLPDEILEVIIRYSGPRHSTAAIKTPFLDKSNWLSCSSVCRRWHRIASPYAFRYIRVTPYGSNVDTGKNRSAHRFQLFLQGNPSIAPLIQEINLAEMCIDLEVLCSILAALPNLQHLVFDCCLIIGKPNQQHPQITSINKLSYASGGACKLYDYVPSACIVQLAMLLRLFTEIGEFEELSLCNHDSYGPPVNLENEAPRIRSYNTQVSLTSLPHLTVLDRMGIFSHLSCLRLTLSSPLHIMGEPLSNFLENVGRSLSELSLKFEHVTPTPFEPQSASETAGFLRRGITACPSLHGFRLELRHGLFNPSANENEIRQTLTLGVEIGVEIISYLHAKEMTHLSFCYKHIFRFCPYFRAEDIHNFDFSKLRDVHRRFVNLRSLALDANSEKGSPEEPHLRNQLIACVRNRLEGFNGVLYHDEPGSFFRCDEPSCAWTSKGKLNEYMTLDREVFGR